MKTANKQANWFVCVPCGEQVVFENTTLALANRVLGRGGWAIMRYPEMGYWCLCCPACVKEYFRGYAAEVEHEAIQQGA